jgi:hypothetical protein
MSEAAAMKFLETLQINFRAGKHESPEHEAKWLKLMVAELKQYTPDVLEQASKDLVRKRADKYFPILSVCLSACEDAKHWIDMGNPRFKLGGRQNASPMSPERERLADDLIMGEMGRQAAHEGWILGLHRFISRRGKMPKPYQIARLKASSVGFIEDFDKARRGGWPQASALVGLGTTMLAKRQSLTEMVLHGVVK